MKSPYELTFSNPRIGEPASGYVIMKINNGYPEHLATVDDIHELCLVVNEHQRNAKRSGRRYDYSYHAQYD